MHRKPFFIVFLCLVVTMAATGAQANAPFSNQAGTGASADGKPAYMPDRVLVQLKPASASRARMQMGATSSSPLLGIPSLDAIGVQVGAISARPAIETFQNSSVASALGLDRWVLIELAPGSDVEAAVAAYDDDPNVAVASPDYIFERLVTPNDPMYPTHWGHNNTQQFRAFSLNSGAHTGAFVGTVGFDANAETGWDGPNGFGVASVIIAIIDSGVNLSHPDLTVVDGWDFGDGDSNPEDDSAMPGHGTWCAGIAAGKANNGLGACGSAPGCSIMPLKVANSAGQFSTVAVANSLVWASDNGANIISMSFGYFPHGSGIPVIDVAIEYANAAGVVMLSGTGNNNNALLYPAMHPHVIGVGAASPCGGRKRSASNPNFLSPGVSPDPNNFTCDGERWWGSSFGPDTQDAPNAVDILGPSMLPTTDIQGAAGCCPGDYGTYFNGVSCATPYVAGVAALIKSRHPDWTPVQVRQQLLTSAQDVVNVESVAGWDRYSGYGMVDIDAAAGCSADVTPPTIAVVMDRNALWPPNHKMVTCCAEVTATDNCDADPSVALVSIVSNEPDNADGGGNTLSDIVGADAGTDDRCFELRSERTGGENGRCYTIVYSATDASSNVAYDTVEVRVPHDQSAAAISSSGFTADGTSLNDGATSFALVVPGSATLEVRRIDTTNLYVGNTAGVIKATDTRMLDINNDQQADLAVFFDASRAQSMTARDGVDAKTIKDEPVGMHFTLDDGTGYLVRNIYALGAPVAMPSVTGKNTDTPEQEKITPAPATEARITALKSIQPNPFNPQTTVHFSLATSERVRISIFDVTGARVRQLVDETMPSGQHQARWDGRSDRGAGVTSGVYFVRMVAGSYNEVRKIVMLK